MPFLANIGGFLGVDGLIILLVALLIFGKNLPEVMRALGRSLNEFKKGMNDVTDTMAAESAAKPVSWSEPKPAPPESAPPASWTPPPGWMPPPGWTPPASWVPPPGWAPPSPAPPPSRDTGPAPEQTPAAPTDGAESSRKEAPPEKTAG